MVYCGKPSRGCQICKNRHIRCDQARPHCLNCKKKGHDCPGYPQEVDLVFRDQTTAVIKRHKKAKIPSEPPSSEDEPDVQQHGDSRGSPEKRQGSPPVVAERLALEIYGLPDPMMHCIFNPSVEQQNTQRFIRNFALPSRFMDTSRGSLHAARSLYHDEKQGLLVRPALDCIALAAAGMRPGNAHVAHLGEQVYGKAMARTHRALLDPLQATSDGALIASLLLSMYEAITSLNHSIVAWQQHSFGSAAIAIARGPENLKDPISRDMFRATRTHLILATLHTGRRMPDFPGPKGWLSDMDDNEDPMKVELISMAVALPNLLYQMKALTKRPDTIDNRSELKEALRTAQNMQRKHIEWELNMPEEWAYRSASVMLDPAHEGNVDDLNAWPGPIHVYDDIYTASIRNNNRVHQALCSRAIMSAVAWLKPDSYFNDRDYLFAWNRVQEVVDDVCASVPFHITGHEVLRMPKPEEFDTEAARGMGGYFLVWPVYSCSIIDCIPDLQRRWLRGRLRRIVINSPLSQASVLEAASLERMNQEKHDIINSQQ